MRSRTLLAVGPWRECARVIASAIANQWSVLHTLLFEDVAAALERTRVDLILLAGCSTREGWEGAARGAWKVCRDTPVVALGSNSGQDTLVCALVGSARPVADGSATPVAGRGAAKNGEGAARRAASRVGDSDGDDGGERPRSFKDVPGLFRCSEVSPTLRLFEPRAAGVCAGVARALEFIEVSYAEPISLADAAGAARMSRCHFSKVFKEQLGVCFVSYLSGVRVRAAAELLERTEMSVTSIAFAVGFNDLSHFERVFRAIQHKSPSRLRAESKEMPGGEKYPPSLPALAVTS
ncbi:MAG: AraC family transcriptional regulator [Acidobacteriota bacterium]|nr:AraC family transcriptional regulator [Acidobacteriota bacterium]MDQ5836893.1 AraC family transcriptional regulator [Acidobacteriota bacterium]